MRRDLPSSFEAMIISATSSLTVHDMLVRGLFVVDTPGITVTLPAPQPAIDGAECIVVNNAADNVTVSAANGFPNNLDSITLASGAGILLYCARTSATSYRWAVVGALPS